MQRFSTEFQCTLPQESKSYTVQWIAMVVAYNTYEPTPNWKQLIITSSECDTVKRNEAKSNQELCELSYNAKSMSKSQYMQDISILVVAPH